MRISRNLAAALGSSVWTALVGLIAVPFYLRYLGVEGYGLIGFLATAQAIAQLLDLGMAKTVNRELARAIVSGEQRETRALLHSVAMVYWGMACAIGIAMMLLSPFFAAQWLRADGMDHKSLTLAVMLMGLVIACRWPAQLYQDALMGAQRIVVSSALSAAWISLASGGAVLVLAFVSPSIEAFLIWQAAVGLAYALAARVASWRVVGRYPVRFDRRQIERIWRFSAGLTGISITGVALSQIDKVVLSKMLSLSDYGHYMLAVLVAATLYLISTPFSNVLYPRLSTLVSANDTTRLAETYRVSTRLLCAIVFPVAMIFCVYPSEIVQAWTANSELALRVRLILPILAIGTALHAVMHAPYALQLAYGMTRLPLTINVVLLLTAAPLTIALVSAQGALGGALSWVSLHVLYLVLGSWLTHRHLLKGIGLKWLVLDVGFPLGVSTSVGLLVFHLPVADGMGVYARVAWGVACAAFASVLIIAASPGLRATALRLVREWLYQAPQGRPT